MMTPEERADDLVDYFMTHTSGKMSDDTRVKYPTAILFSKKICSEVFGFMGSDRGYKYWSDVMDALNKK